MVIHRDKALITWEGELASKSEGTRKVYLSYLEKFLDRWEIPRAEELYDIRKKDLESEDSRDHRNIEQKINIQMGEMMEAGYAASTARMLAKSLTSFFEAQGLPLKVKPKDKPKGFANGQRMALVEQIRDMWDHAPEETKLKMRAMLMVTKDSGLRVSDLAALDVGDYLEAREVCLNDEKFVVFNPKGTVKTAAPAFIHLGPEATKVLDEYLEAERAGASPDEPLFVMTDNLSRFEPKTLSGAFLRMGRKVGKKITAHSLRKFHTTALQSAGVNNLWIKLLQGKTLESSMAPYTNPQDDGSLTEAYIRAYPRLRIFGEEVSAQKIEDQAAEIEALRRQVEEERVVNRRELEAQVEKEQRRRQTRDDQIKSLEWRCENLESLFRMALVDEEGVSLKDRMAEIEKAFKDRKK